MLVVKYALFAAISIALNLLVQAFFLSIYNGTFSLYTAMFAGTLAGLVSKYLLDKKYIFYHKSENIKEDGRKFLLYSFMGIFTTFLFWAFEIGFDALLKTASAKYIGGFLGLCIGYYVKYILDKRFVFKVLI